MPACADPIPEWFHAAATEDGISGDHCQALWALYPRWMPDAADDARLAGLLDDYAHWRLFERSRAGDEAAARRFEQHWKRAARAFVGRGFTVDQVDELAAIFFARAYDKATLFHWQRPFTVHLKTVLLNIARDELRRVRRRLRHHESLDDQLERHPEVMHSDQPGADDELISNEAKAAVWRAIGRLKDRDREVVIACLIEGRPGPEVAADFGLTQPALHQRLYRARRQLRTYLEKGI